MYLSGAALNDISNIDTDTTVSSFTEPSGALMEGGKRERGERGREGRGRRKREGRGGEREREGGREEGEREREREREGSEAHVHYV